MAVVAVLSKTYPQFTFAEGKVFSWSPAARTIFYPPQHLKTSRGTLALLHELSHALLGHDDFAYDIELLSKELAAWAKARQLAAKLSIKVDEEYVYKCLESYREWLYRRSRCPGCNEAGVQLDRSYRCFMCGQNWRVTQSRHTHPYRIKV